MVSWSKLLFDKKNFGDRLRYRKRTDLRPIVVWNITRSCNLDCVHCYIDATPLINSTNNIEKEKKVISQLAQFSVPVLLFSGGEPLVYENIFALLDFAKNKGLRTVISTNATLITPPVAEKIKKCGVSYVGVSFDGDEETHNSLRGKGSFQKALEGVKNCQSLGIKTGLRFTLMRQNYKKIGTIFDFAAKEGIPRICIYHLAYTGRGSVEDDITAEQKKEAMEIIWDKVHLYKDKLEVLTVDSHSDCIWLYKKMLKENKEKAEDIYNLCAINGGNRSGEYISCIDERGEVYIDQFLREFSLGNVHQKSFSQIWQNEDNNLLFSLRHRRRELIKGKCKKCAYFSICNGNLRARAYYYSGDLWQEDPGCYLDEEEVTEKA